MTTWRKEITKCFEITGEKWSQVVSCTLTAEELDAEFDDGFGSHEGKPFTIWTGKRVYFPAVYDGAEWVVSVSRDPDGMPTEHVGGE